MALCMDADWDEVLLCHELCEEVAVAALSSISGPLPLSPTGMGPGYESTGVNIEELSQRTTLAEMESNTPTVPTLRRQLLFRGLRLKVGVAHVRDVHLATVLHVCAVCT